MTTDRVRLVELARKLIAGDYEDDDELDRDMAEFAANVPHPAPSDLTYYWETSFDHEPTPDEVVDRALSYRPIEL
jgi:hypothetical protein